MSRGKRWKHLVFAIGIAGTEASTVSRMNDGALLRDRRGPIAASAAVGHEQFATA